MLSAPSSRKTVEDPPAYLVELLFAFKGLKQIEVA